MAVPHVPRRWGIPLVVALFDGAAAGDIPSLQECSSPTLCGGRRFYTVCYNGGNDRVHCDETETLAHPDQWRQVAFTLWPRFAGKYDGVVPTRLAVRFASVAADVDPVEALIDDVTLVHPDFTPCTLLSVTAGNAAGGYDDLVMLARPVAYYRLSAAAATDAASDVPNWDGGPYSGSFSPARAPAPALAPGETDGASRFGPNAHVQLPPFSVTRGGSGFAVSLWVQVVELPAAGSKLLFGDRLGRTTGTGQVAVSLSAAGMLEVHSATSVDVAARTATEPLAADGTPHHVVVRWDAVYGGLDLHVDGQNVTLAHSGGHTYHTGSDRTPGADMYIGDPAGSGTVVLDEVVVFPYFIPGVTVRALFVGVHDGFDAAASGDTALAFDSSAYAFTAGESGIKVVVLDGTTLTHKTTVNFPDASRLQPGLDAFTAFMNSSAAGEPGDVVLAALKGDARRRVLYETRFSSEINVVYNSSVWLPPANPDTFNTSGIDYARFVLMSDLEGAYAYSWAGAKAYCEDNGRRLCSSADLCNRHGQALTTNLASYFGQVEGAGWSPVSDGTDVFIAVGKAYASRVCRFKEEIVDRDFPDGTACWCMRGEGGRRGVGHARARVFFLLSVAVVCMDGVSLRS